MTDMARVKKLVQLNTEEEQQEKNENLLNRQEEDTGERKMLLNKREKELKEWNDYLCTKEKDLEIRLQRREIQLETLEKQDDEIHMQIEQIKTITKIKQEKEEEQKNDGRKMQDQALQIKRNDNEIKKQEEKLQILKQEINDMKKQTFIEKQQILTDKQWIEEERKACKKQSTEIENKKEKILGQELANKEAIHRQETEKCKNEKEIHSQIAYLHKLKEKINECEGTLKEQEQMKQMNNGEIEQQSNQLQDQKTLISTQKEELLRQKLETKKNAEEIQTQATVLYKLNECEITLQKQEHMMQTNQTEMEQQINQIQEQTTQINSQYKEIKEQEMDKWMKAEQINSQIAYLHKLKEKINECKGTLEEQEQMKQINNAEIEEQSNQLQDQKTLISTQKEELFRQKLETMKNEEEIKTQVTVLNKLNEEVNDSVKTLQKQENMKQIIRREIDQQIASVQEQKIKINTQKEEIHKQELEKMLNEENIKCQTALLHKIKEEMNECEALLQNQKRKIERQINYQIQTLKNIQAAEQEEIRNETIQKQLIELQKLHEQNVKLIRIEAQQMKHREIRSKKEDLHVLQNMHDQLVNRHSSSNYTQDNQSDLNINDDLEKIIEKMKIELQRSLEEPAADATQGSAGTNGDTLQKHKDHTKKKTKENSQEEDASANISDLIRRLNLNSFFPHKLTTADALNISRTSFNIQEPQSEQPLKDDELAFVFLRKLLKLDYRARNMTKNKRNMIHCEHEDMFEEVEYFDDFQNEEDECSNSNEEGNTQIHPMDIQMAVFHCADSFLRQNIVIKLSSCQYALPLLVPSPTSTDIEFLLWTFREIKKTWRSVGCSSISLPVCQVKAPMVFFCRLGSVSTSKSQLLNSLINPKHDTFFHKYSPGSSKSHMFMDGMVEIAWYCPAGNTDDHFNECIAFCNLHGDAVEHRKQTDFLTEQATVNIVLVQNMKLNDEAKELLQKLHSSSKPLICVVNDLQKGLKMSGNSIRIGLKDTQNAGLCKELIQTIQMCLQKCDLHPTFNLEESSELAKQCGFRVDEDSEDCQKGKNAALKVMELLTREDISQIKAKFLPCQGKLWHEWSRKNKQLYRFYGQVEQTKSKIQQEMHAIRNQQRKQSLDLINAVHENLNSMSITKKVYFVKWLGVYLDGSFSDQLSQVTQQYYKQLTELYLLKQKGKDTDERQKELERLSEKVDAMTLGLEHIVREMGQLYEAWSAKPEEMNAVVSALPALAADLLISGHPLELMDGDAAHVPLTWIESVLDKVIERLGDQRVFVLSVLGLQSSGKSTMLNTMFGLQFAVSAGRCTRGAFMQLIRVKEEATDELKFDYLLVVDSKGLQSLQLVSKQSALTHDNELAPFVTGLADLTLINIFGENPAEMQNIIQIVVQAFLRMKKVRLTPSCMFVHQNATDISAGEKNMEGRMQLQEKLDKITRLAAAEEGCSAQYFTEVIKINIQTDVHYIFQLWEGNPPMAPPNPRYSENIEKLKQAILRSAAQKKCLRFSELKVRIEDLWTAVLNEDFVFSFKNTLEISAEKRLETMYGNWTWTLRENLLFIQNKLQNQIENGNLLIVDQKQILEDLSYTFSTVKKQMETFFTEDKDAEILSQWKEKSEQRITDVHDKLIADTARKMTQLVSLKATCEILNNTKTQLENELFNRSKEFTSRRKGKTMDEWGIRNEFQSMWEKWLSTIEIPPMENCDINNKVGEILRSYFGSQTFYSRIQEKKYKCICIKGDYTEYVTLMKDVFHLTCYNLTTEDHPSVQQLVQEIVREAEEIIRNKPVVRMGYSDAYTQEIVNCVKKRVGGFKAKTFQLNREFTVDLTLYVCEIAVRAFTVCQKTFREANDPLIYLEKKKEDFYSIFKKQCEGATATTVFADFVCSKLKPSILQAVYDQAAIDAAREMKSDFPAFRGNRSNLEKHILQDLAEEEFFERFITYIKNPKKYFSDFIEVGIKSHMFEGENPRILHILKNAVKMKTSSVATTIQVTQDTMQNKNVKQWLERFSLEIKDEIKFSVNDFKGALYQDITDTVFFGEVLNKALQTVFNYIITSFDHISSVTVEMFRQRPEDILMEQLCGCWVQCPGCKAICTNTIQGHDGDHCVPFHRPSGISGWNWQGTDNLLVDICTSLVVGDACICLEDGRRFPWRKYRQAGPVYACWSICPNPSEQPYWKWFVCRFQTDLEQHYKKTFQGHGEIPSAWRKITKKKALESLNV